MSLRVMKKVIDWSVCRDNHNLPRGGIKERRRFLQKSRFYQRRVEPGEHTTANCIIIAQVPIENHSDQGQFAQLPLKTIGKVQNLGDYYAIRIIGPKM